MKKTVTLEQIYTELLAFRKEQSVVNAKQASFNETITRRLEAGFAKQATFNEAIAERVESGFARQFGYFERKFAEVYTQLDNCATKQDIHRALDATDGQAKRLDDQEAETAALVSQTRRHEYWLQRLAKVAAKYLNTT